MSVSLALFLSVLFISLMQFVNRPQFLIIIFLKLFAAVFATVIVAIPSIYASLNHINLTLTLKF